MALKLVSSNDDSPYLVEGEILIVFTRDDVLITYTEYVEKHAALAVGHLEKLKAELTAFIKYSNLA